MKLRLLSLAVAVLAPLASLAPAAGSDDVPHVFVFTRTDGFRHGSIAKSKAVLQQLATDTGAYTVEFSEDVAAVTPELLERTDILLFANTTGEHPFSADQKAQLEQWLLDGGGFLGIHAAADTNYQWPAYQELVGAAFQSHPHTGGGLPGTTLGQQARVQVEDGEHPITQAWAGQDSFLLREEYYRWRENPRGTQDVHVLLSLDETSTYTSPRDLVPGLQQPVYPDDQPLEWVKSYRGANRVWYTNLGHYDATYDRTDWQQHFLAALRWVAAG